jgi:NAD(P)-dependent dehydrogenase (short-subunit alcohol dehydrogenase family)
MSALMVDTDSALADVAPIALLTGAGAGIGRLLAFALAEQGCRLLLAGRTPDKLEAVRQGLIARGLRQQLLCIPLDLADLDSVQRAAAQVLDQVGHIDLLINNAGVAAERGLTSSGFERAFGINHLGHFALTLRLWPAIVRAPSPRVITVASRAHHYARRWDWERLQQPTSSLTGVPEYAQSKLANILFASELAERARSVGVFSVSLHPGVLDTEIWRRLPVWLQWVNRWRLRAPQEGVASILHAACQLPERANGCYLSGIKPQQPSKLARDRRLSAELWQRSLEWAQINDPIGA